MNKQEEILKQALEKITPVVWDSIAEDIRNEMAEKPSLSENTYVFKAEDDSTLTVVNGGVSQASGDMTEKKRVRAKTGKRTPWYTQLAAVAAVMVVVLGGVWGFNSYKIAHSIDSIISLDVNPSIELATNSKERVIGVEAGNEDAVKILGDMDLKGSDIDVALNALIGSLLRNGYIDEAKNSILISVNNKDHEKSEALRQRLLEEISSILESDGIKGAVLSRTAGEDKDDELEELAEKYGISEAKALLIRDICESNPRYSFEDIVDLNINELNLLTESPNVELAHIQSTGKASDKEYIGRDKAVSLALAAAGVQASEARDIESEMDYESGVMVYEVEFETADGEYEFDINALTGDIVKKEVEKKYSKSSSASNNSTSKNNKSNYVDDDDDDDDIYDADDDDDDDIDEEDDDVDDDRDDDDDDIDDDRDDDEDEDDDDDEGDDDDDDADDDDDDDEEDDDKD